MIISIFPDIVRNLSKLMKNSNFDYVYLKKKNFDLQHNIFIYFFNFGFHI